MIVQDARMNLVLVAIHIEASPRSVPLGPAMLASVLRRAYPEAIQTRILDLFLQQSAQACAELILASDPDWVGFSIYVWNRSLSREIAQILSAPEMRAMLAGQGLDAVTSTPEQFGALMKADLTRWAQVVKTAGIRAE